MMKKFFTKLISIALLLIASVGLAIAKGDVTVSSPDGKLKYLLTTDNGQLFMSVTLNELPVIPKSPLHMSVNDLEITSGIVTGKAMAYQGDETFPLFGYHSTAINRYNGCTVSLRNKAGKVSYNLDIRVFNDAAAFRFVVPEKSGSINWPDESTVFRLPAGSTAWYHDLYMHYEGVHAKKLVDTIPAGQWAAPPLTFKLPGNTGYASITEANLVNYAGMALQSDGKNGFELRLGHSHPASYPYKLRYSKEDVERLSKIAGVEGTITTPWQIIAGKDLNSLVNSDAVYSLCSPPDPKLFPDGCMTSWVKPGRAVWRYLDGGGDQTLQNMKVFSKQAAELGFEYNILENFWSKWPDDSVRALVDYSKKLGVGIILWRHSNTLHDAAARHDLFQKCHDLGVAGLKIDFFDHEAKEVVGLYQTILKETAEFNLICIFHGANKPTGLWRTYPNAMIYEGVKGMEASKLLDRATHETTIPFTRMIAGPADYSVCHFGARRQNTTWIHQAATTAIFCAPIITYAATPAHILENPCAGMLKSVPATWDETIVLQPSEIGELAVYAQRKGSSWFLSVINGLKAREINIPLTFLGKGNYNTLILKDNPDNPADAAVLEGTAVRSEIISLKLGTGGGYMCRFNLK